MTNTPPLVTADHWNTPPPGLLPVYGYDAVNNAVVDDVDLAVALRFMSYGLNRRDVQ